MGNLRIHMYAQALPSLHFNNQHLLRKDLQYKCSLREQSRADKRKRSDKTPRFPLFFHSFLLLQSSQPQTLTEIYNLSWLHFYSDFLKLKHKGEVHFQQDWQQHEWNLQKCPFGKHVYGALPSQLPASAAPTDSSRPTDCWEVHPENPVFTLVSQKRDSNIWNAEVNKSSSFESRWKHGLVVEAKAEQKCVLNLLCLLGSSYVEEKKRLLIEQGYHRTGSMNAIQKQSIIIMLG